MTTKADFSEDEWKTILEAPTSAGLLVITASPGGTFRETFSMAKAYTEAREQHGASELLDEIVSHNPKVDRHAGKNEAEADEHWLGEIRDAVGLIQSKATPQELEDFRNFVVGLSERVAHAHREGGVEVSPAEQAAIDKIKSALGADGAPDAPAA
jgi:hypothetical protein